MPGELKESLIEQMGLIPLTGRLLGDLTLSEKKRKWGLQIGSSREAIFQHSHKDLGVLRDVNYPVLSERAGSLKEEEDLTPLGFLGCEMLS